MLRMTILFIIPLLLTFKLLRANDSNIADASGIQFSTEANLPPFEIEALKDLYDSTNGTNWLWKSTVPGIPWNFSDPNANPCIDSWQGMMCSYDGGDYQHVTSLILVKYGLSGSLPGSLSNLTMLEAFLTGENRLIGTIPASMGNLSQLQYLSAYSNKLSGVIPESLGNLSQLIYLDVDTNKLTGTIPASLGNLSQLQHFDIFLNALTGTIPASLGSLSQLLTLAVYSNKLSGDIPASLGNLSLLQHLEVDSNKLSGNIPASLGSLAQLLYLNVYSNALSGAIPASLGDLSLLQSLAAYSNALSGEIPASLGNLTQLQYLDLNINKLSGTIPASIGGLSQLLYLYVNSNKLTGVIPVSLGDLSHLQYLYAYSNELSGTIPASLGNLSQLLTLSLFSNKLTGTVPSALGGMSQLRTLALYSNELSGTIPVALDNLSQLQALYLYSNKLTGSIPDSLAHLSRLQYLEVNSNRLSGTIPASLGSLSQLLYLEIYLNKLTGTIPASLGSLSQLLYLGVRGNALSGTIPAALSNLSRLQYLDVYINKLTGTIPSVLGDLSQMQNLNLATNKLTGTIPASLGNLSQLQYLYVHSNALTGTVPASLGGLPQLLYLNVHTNDLVGTVPDALANLHALQGLYMENNRLTGTLPSWFGSCSQLQYLSLSNNSFAGAIPESLGSLTELFQLSLDSNGFTSTIPHNLAHLISLNSFAVDHNSLSGSLDGVFDPAVQTGLATILVNDNQLTGTIPSAIFDLPSLNAVVASTNCFHGQLPVNICNSTSLVSVVLDGLSAAPTCKNYLFPGLSHSYTLESSVHGTVPTCLFQLPALNTLHLSGNGFTGSIISDRTAVSLTDLSLSHNRLTGTIPFQLQNKSWAVLDLSFNRLHGSLSHSLATNKITLNMSTGTASVSGQMSLSLENNRLSGRIPRSVQTLQDVSILGTNTFSCKLDGSDLPQHDSGVSNYQCGSSEFDVPYYVWLGLCCLAAALVCCALRFRSSLQRFGDVNSAVNSCEKWLRCVIACGVPTTNSGAGPLYPFRHIKSYCYELDAVSKHALVCTAVILVVLLPLYTALSHYYGTHLQAYAWTVSAAYLSGAVPIGLEMALWLVLLCLGMGSLLYCCPPRQVRTNPPSTTIKTNRQLVLIYMLFLSINVVIVGGVNVAYVYVSIYRSSQLLTFTQIFMSFFKVIYNGIASTAMLRFIVLKVAGEELQLSGYATLRVLSSLVNNIVIPFVVVLVVSPSCFYNVFATAPPVSAIVTFDRCEIVSTDTGACAIYASFPVTSSYDPPFTYSYQCSSSLVTYYAPAFVNLCIVSMFVMPIAHLLAVEALRRADKSTRWFQLLNKAVPTTWKLPAIGETSDTTRTYFNPLKEQLTQLNFVSLIFTFGVVFPPLAAALAVTLVVCTVITKLKLGRLLQHVCDHDGWSIARSVELACESLLGSALLRDFVGMLSVIACLFYTLFLFDTLGDAVGFHKAYWVLIVVPLLPVCAICTHWALGARSPLHLAGQQETMLSNSDREPPGVEMTAVPSFVSSGTETFNAMRALEADMEGQH